MNLKNNGFNDCQFQMIVEPQPLGTGGAVLFAINQLGFSEHQRFILINGDTWSGCPFLEMLNSSRDSMSCVKVSDVGRYGSIEIDRSSCVVALKEKFQDVSNHHSGGYINAGIFCLTSGHVPIVESRVCSLEVDIIPKMIARRQIDAHISQQPFFDIGVPEDYLSFCRFAISDGLVSA